MTFTSPDFPGLTFETLEELAKQRREQKAISQRLAKTRVTVEVKQEKERNESTENST